MTQTEFDALAEEAPEVLTCLKFPGRLQGILEGITSYHATTLAEVFRPVLQMRSEDLLHMQGTPEQVQLRMTAYLLNSAYDLYEKQANDVTTSQVLVNLALQCEQVQYQGARKR